MLTQKKEKREEDMSTLLLLHGPIQGCVATNEAINEKLVSFSLEYIYRNLIYSDVITV